MTKAKDSGKSSGRVGWNWDHSYTRLPEVLFERRDPEPVEAPKLIYFHRELAERLGLDGEVLEGENGAEIFAGNRMPEGAEPIAQAYAGHQFGHFTMLGDGRAILLGEQIAPDGARFDLQLKGSGRTAFSRRGDGRAALGPMLREALIGEAMHALGIPTTRALAVVSTGEPVFRETKLPGAVLVRVAASHIRVGTFEYLAARRDPKVLREMVDYTLRRHYPEEVEQENAALALLRVVARRQASLIARWQMVGFIHGVMNTDNMALSGETIDYGPCAFMDRFHPETVFSSIDHQGRYAYGNQPVIAQWNLARFAEALLPLIDEKEEQAVALAGEEVKRFAELFRSAWIDGMRKKIGLRDEEEGDIELIEKFLEILRDGQLDFARSFRQLCDPGEFAEAPLEGASFQEWHRAWQERLERSGASLEEARSLMRRHNPAVIARNYLVEEALSAATEKGDLKPFHRLLEAVSNPWAVTPQNRFATEAPPESFHDYQTFCGT